MDKKSIIIAVIIGLILFILPFVLYFFVSVSEDSAMPEPNIPTQTKTAFELELKKELIHVTMN